MKVYLENLPKDGVGGIVRVLQSLYQYLPKHGIDIVDTIEEADVIHVQVTAYHTYPVEIPVVVSSHGLMWAEDGWGNYGWKVNQQCMKAYVQADYVTAPSKFVANAIERNCLVHPSVVQHGINPDEWLPGISEGYVLWNKGRVDSACNPEPLLKLAEMCPDEAFVTTFGKGGNNVKTVGKVSHDEMRTLVQNAGVYLITPRESGGPSFGVLEAMACGVPVLSWNYGGTAEAIEHGVTGYLAEPGNYDDLVDGLYHCLTHRDTLGNNARQVVLDRYDVRQNITQYIDVYQQAVKHEDRPKVSVIVPCHNLGRFLPACIESVKKQTYQDWELIIIDDASTDNTWEVAERFKTSRIKVLRNDTNRHVSASRNRAILSAKGHYILPLDADDRLYPNALEKLVDELDASRDYQIVGGNLVIYNEHDLNGNGMRSGWPNNTDYEQQIAGNNRMPYASMYRRKVWENIGGYRERIRSGVEDADFWTRALSYGYRPKIIKEDTLAYTHRNNSLGKQNQRGSGAWLAWFGWAHDPEVTPLAALGKGPYSSPSYDSPEVSVVVPVGPGHKRHIQTIVDSLIAQSFNNWELILVNDTGTPWNMHIPFARVIEFNQTRGVAAARNVGVKAAKANKIVFLDADDILQPLALSVLIKAHSLVGGWIYGDWYYEKDGSLVHETSDDWSAQGLANKSLGPITGLYEKNHVLSVGGFDETAPGWEDWDFHLKLLERGICGTRVEYPLIMYNMHLGWRREENFSQHKDLLQYIHEKHKNLYRGNNMGCSKCGGKKTLVVTKASSNTKGNTMSDLVRIQYDGPMTQFQRFNSKVQRGVVYRFNNSRPFQALREDAEWILNIKHFKLVSAPATVPETVVNEPLTTDIPVKMPSVEEEIKKIEQEKVVVEDTAMPSDEWSVFPDEITRRLQRNFTTVDEVKKASDAQLLSINGIGEGRLKAIREVLNA